MERKEFFNKISGGLAFTCVACMMAACSKEGTTGTGNNTGGGNTGGGGTGSTLLTINLTSQLLAIDDFVSDKGIIVVRKAAGNAVSSFVAFVSACPHQGVAVTFRKGSNDFIVLPMAQLSLLLVLLPSLPQQVDCRQELLKSVVLRLP